MNPEQAQPQQNQPAATRPASTPPRHKKILINQILFWLLNIIEIFIIVGAVIVMFGYHKANAFFVFIVAVTSLLTAPFTSIVAPTVIDGFVLDWTYFIALVVYALLVYFLAAIIKLLRSH